MYTGLFWGKILLRKKFKFFHCLLWSLREKLVAFWQISILNVRRDTIRSRFFFKEKLILLTFFWDRAEVYFDVGEKTYFFFTMREIFFRVDNLGLYRSRCLFWRNIFFWTHSYFSNVFGLRVKNLDVSRLREKNLQPLGRNSPAGLSRFHSMSSNEHFQKNMFEKVFFSKISEFERTFLFVWAKISHQAWQFCVLRVRRAIWKKNIVLRK